MSSVLLKSLDIDLHNPYFFLGYSHCYQILFLLYLSESAQGDVGETFQLTRSAALKLCHLCRWGEGFTLELIGGF